MKLSSVYGMETTGKDGKSGYVVSVHASGGKLRYFICADENEKEFTVEAGAVIKYGERIVFKSCCPNPEPAPAVRLGRAVFDDRGAYMGLLEDFTFSGEKILKAKVGKKNYPADGLVYGDVIIIKTGRKLRGDVKKDGRVIIKKGTAVNAETLETAFKEGEYVQTRLKSI